MPWCKDLLLASSSVFMALGGLVKVLGSDTLPQAISTNDDSAIPSSLNEESFEALFTNSPFTRSLGISDSIILTGIARIEGEVYATLLDTETLKSQVVSKTVNFQGWRLVDVTGDPAESRTWSAKIQVVGGQVVSVRYQKPPTKRLPSATNSTGSAAQLPPLSSSQEAEAKNAAINYQEGFSSDGYPRKPPPEMVQKLSRLSVGQREDINRQMLGWRNKGLGLDDRRKIYENLVERAGQRR